MIKINNFRDDLSNISAKTATLSMSYRDARCLRVRSRESFCASLTAALDILGYNVSGSCVQSEATGAELWYEFKRVHTALLCHVAQAQARL